MASSQTQSTSTTTKRSWQGAPGTCKQAPKHWLNLPQQRRMQQSHSDDLCQGNLLLPGDSAGRSRHWRSHQGVLRQTYGAVVGVGRLLYAGWGWGVGPPRTAALCGCAGVGGWASVFVAGSQRRRADVCVVCAVATWHMLLLATSDHPHIITCSHAVHLAQHSMQPRPLLHGPSWLPSRPRSYVRHTACGIDHAPHHPRLSAGQRW